MNSIDLIGTMAATFTTISFLPQTLKVIKTRHTKDLSLWMYIILTIGLFLWLAYGIATMQWSLIIGNAICFPLCLIILMIKIKNKD